MSSRAKRKWWILAAILAAWLTAVISLDGIDQIKTAAGIAALVFASSAALVILIALGLLTVFYTRIVFFWRG